MDAPVLAPDYQQRNQYSDWVEHREQVTRELAMLIPRRGVYQECEHCQARQQPVEQEALVLPEEAEADGFAKLFFRCITFWLSRAYAVRDGRRPQAGTYFNDLLCHSLNVVKIFNLFEILAFIQLRSIKIPPYLQVEPKISGHTKKLCQT